MTTKSNGVAIRRIREAKGIGCPQLAAVVGIDRRFLNKIERGLQQGSPRTRLAIAQALGVDLSEITYPEDAPCPCHTAVTKQAA